MKLLQIILGLVLTFSLSQAVAFEKEAKSRSAVINLTSQKPLAVGNNAITLEIKKNGKLSEGDTVTTKAFMPAMPGMPYMENRDAAKYLGDGKYKTTINFSMGGTWQIHIFVTPKEGKKYRVKTSVNL